VGHNPKKRYPYPARSLKINRLGFTMTWLWLRIVGRSVQRSQEGDRKGGLLL